MNRIVNSIYDEALAPFNLTLSQLNVLTVIIQAGPISPARIGKAIHLERSTLSRNLKLMEEAGWIRISAADRGLEVEITRSGENLYDRCMVGWKKAQKTIHKALEQDGIEAIRVLFSKLISPGKEDDDAGS
ncbi:MarR family winged helix-turn-helix transcriptional regulator [Bdellovibrio sp.]|uniref:MarR family winged helix-turn-helix transcriptional regulator n=1 Tax=Bdellovibrio sp. TaxID=28201 RepID=UPI002F350326